MKERPGYRPWTKDEEQWMLANYSKQSKVDVAKHLGRTEYSVRMKATALGIQHTTTRHRMVDWRGGFTVRTAEQYAYSQPGGIAHQLERLTLRLEEVRECLTRLRFCTTGKAKPDYEGEQMLVRHVQDIKEAIHLRQQMWEYEHTHDEQRGTTATDSPATR